ncbi:MAG: putative Ig domain-containing protein [Candidatus Latescibacterota bacterium]
MGLRHLVIAGAVLLLGHAPTRALRFYVDNNPAGAGDDRRSVASAQHAATPFRTITHALRIAHTIREGRPHVITVAAGTYSPSSGESLPLTITQTRIYLSAGGRVVLDGEGRTGLVRLLAPTSDLVLGGMEFRNGRAERGAAIYCETCSLRVHDSRFYGNQATLGGHVLYSRNGRVHFDGNILRGNGVAGTGGALIELHDVFADTSQRETVRNNTFYANAAPHLATSGNRTDFDSNISSLPGGPAIVDSAAAAGPLVRYNLFWQTEILLLSSSGDSIKVARTVRDTLTTAEQGFIIPSFVTAVPDTVALIGQPYRWRIPLAAGPTRTFDPIVLPTGAPADSVRQGGVVVWTPAPADTGRHQVSVDILDNFGNPTLLLYYVHVYTPEAFPDTTYHGPIVQVSLVPDTAGAVAALNALVPVFSAAASAGSNLYADPRLLGPDFDRYELLAGSPAIDAGNPAASLNQPLSKRLGSSDMPRSNIGHTGGPAWPQSPPPDTSFVELEITSLPDSVARQGQVYTLDPTVAGGQRVELVDLIAGTGAPSMHPYLTFGRQPPITWTPTLADTGQYLIGVTVYTNRSQGRHYFPLHVRAANEPPAITSAPDTVANEDRLYEYRLAASDPNADVLTFVLTAGPPGMGLDAGTGRLTWTPTQEQVGRHSVEVQVRDPQNPAVTQSFFLRVLASNDTPSFTTAPDTLATEDVTYRYAAGVLDPDPGEQLTFTLATRPAGMVVDTAGVVQWTPGPAQVGVHRVVLRVTDTAGATAEQSYTLRVVAVNDPPVLQGDPDSTAVEDQAYRYRVQATDEEGGRLTFRLLSGPQGATIDSTGLISWVPQQQDVGRHELLVEVADPGGLTAERRFAVTVTAVNDAPRIISVNPPTDTLLVVTPGRPVLYTAQAVDEETPLLTYSWWLNGVAQTTVAGTSLERVPRATGIDTLVLWVGDGADSTSATWYVDGRTAARLSLDADTLDFGVVALGDTGRAAAQIGNTGTAPLVLADLEVSDLQFAAALTADTVAPGATARLDVRFIPADRGAAAGEITFATSDATHPVGRLTLVGSGRLATSLGLDLDPAAGSQGLTTAEAVTGQEVVLSIHATRAAALGAFEADLRFDAGLLRFAGVAPTVGGEPNLLAAGGGQVTVTAAVLGDTILQVRAAAPGSAGASGQGLLAVVRFTAGASLSQVGEAVVSLAQARLWATGAVAADTLAPDLQVRVHSPSLRGDFTGDGRVDLDDFFVFADHFGQVDARFDLDGSGGAVNMDDFFVFADLFGTGTAAGLRQAGLRQIRRASGSR